MTKNIVVDLSGKLITALSETRSHGLKLSPQQLGGATSHFKGQKPPRPGSATRGSTKRPTPFWTAIEIGQWRSASALDTEPSSSTRELATELSVDQKAVWITSNNSTSSTGSLAKIRSN
ncbi:hypothetical protein KIN20_035860 [Parelaphostrongylus tenuis]|uniref:Uncharacterized protein n=1 Tax=Parelaphostrongylus tenuis TaxID=148309 RepID=A0AAD5WK15_PARTN|nr:hypothetical protein KIN20_035860 [Parelaphostrongylus tenuis]